MPDACCSPGPSHGAPPAPSIVPAALRALLKSFKDSPPTPGLTWAVTAFRLPAYVKISPHTPFFRPFGVFTAKRAAPGEFSLLGHSLEPALWVPPHSCDALPPLENVLAAVAGLVRQLGMSPASLLVAQPVFAAGLQPLLAPLGVCVGALEPGDAAALEAAARPAGEALGDKVVGTAPKMAFMPNFPPRALAGKRFPLLRDSSPQLSDAHLRAFFALANDLVGLAPWALGTGLSESVLLRMYFPGGAEPAPGYVLPAGEVFWVHINGQHFAQEMERARRRVPPGASFKIEGLERDIGLRIFLRRSDAEGFLLAPINNVLRQMAAAKQPPPHPRATKLPCPARPSPAEELCLVCGAPGRRCEKCGGVAYCGAACAAQNAAAHKPVCSPAARVVPGAPPRAQLAGHTLKVKMFELHEAPLGEMEELGRVGGALCDGDEVPVAVREEAQSVSRPPLLDFTRIVRAMGVLTAFLRDRENVIRSSIPRPQAEVFVPFSSPPRRLGGAWRGFCLRGAPSSPPTPPPPPLYPNAHTTPLHRPPPFLAGAEYDGRWHRATGERAGPASGGGGGGGAGAGARAEAGGGAYVYSDFVVPEWQDEKCGEDIANWQARIKEALKAKDRALQFLPPQPAGP
jgi:hypothetical protein